MHPPFAAMDCANCTRGDVKPIGNLALEQLALESKNFARFIIGKLGKSMPLPAIRCAVSYLVGLVLLAGFPLKVVWVAAAKMTLAAIMRRLMPRGWRRTVDGLAYQAVNGPNFAAEVDNAVTPAIVSKGPTKTIVTSIRDGGFFEETLRFTFEYPAAERVAVPTPSKIVRVAPAVPCYGLAAIWN